MPKNLIPKAHLIKSMEKNSTLVGKNIQRNKTGLSMMKNHRHTLIEERRFFKLMIKEANRKNKPCKRFYQKLSENLDMITDLENRIFGIKASLRDMHKDQWELISAISYLKGE